MGSIKIVSLCFLIGLFSLNSSAYAGCMSECKDSYESEVDSCKSLWGDDPEDYDDLQNCIENANDEYESCKEECLS